MIINRFDTFPSLLNTFIAEIRDVEIQKDAMRFRRNIERIGEVLGYEMSKTLTYQEKEVTTPLGSKKIRSCTDQLVLCSVLRCKKRA